MIAIDYHASVACPFTARQITAIAQAAAHYEKKITGHIEVSVVGEKKIRELNRHYRGKDKVTDVLSFAWQEDKTSQSAMLAQIYLCYRQIIRQAKEFEVSSREEFTRMLVHGLLHSVGYDHAAPKEAKKMFTMQEKIVARVL